MELRDEFQTGQPTPRAPQILSKSGTLCATATDKSACESALADARSSGWAVTAVGMEMPRERYLVATVGDQLEFATSEADLLQFVAPVDTAFDAALLVTANGTYRIECGKPNARKTATGWEIRTLTGTACGQGTKIEEQWVSVTTSGEKYTTKTTLIQEGDPNCAF
jgi:hypothetical protein